MSKPDFIALRAPFSNGNISWRKGQTAHDERQAQALPYIDARAVQNRLDEVVGPECWSVSYCEVHSGDKLVAARCALAIKVEGEWVSKEDSAPLSASELGLKGMYSDALKRAAVQWGIGRYLYAYKAPFVDLNEAGNMVSKPVLPNEFLPKEEWVDASTIESATLAGTKDTESKAKAQATAAALADAKADADAKAKADADADAKAKADADAKAKADADAKAKAKADADAKAKAKADKVAEAKATLAAALAAAEGESEDSAEAESNASDAASSQVKSDMEGDTGISENVSPEEKMLIDEMLAKIKTMGAPLLQAYLNGAKAKSKLSEQSRQFLLSEILRNEELKAQAAT
jgi:hypothetical protein